MKTRRVKASSPFMAMTNLTLASWETIARRMLLISKNKCSQAEYRRMVSEKARAAMLWSFKLISSNGRASITSLMAPWLSRASANAKAPAEEVAPHGKVGWDSCGAAVLELESTQSGFADIAGLTIASSAFPQIELLRS